MKHITREAVYHLSLPTTADSKECSEFVCPVTHPRKAAESLAAFLEVADQVVIHSSAGTSHLTNRANLLQPLGYKLYMSRTL